MLTTSPMLLLFDQPPLRQSHMADGHGDGDEAHLAAAQSPLTALLSLMGGGWTVLGRRHGSEAALDKLAALARPPELHDQAGLDYAAMMEADTARLELTDEPALLASPPTGQPTVILSRQPGVTDTAVSTATGGARLYGSSAAVGDLQDAVGSLRGELCGVRAELAETAGNLRQLTGLVQQLLAVGGIPAHHQLPALQHGAPGVRCQTVAAASLPLLRLSIVHMTNVHPNCRHQSNI